MSLIMEKLKKSQIYRNCHIEFITKAVQLFKIDFSLFYLFILLFKNNIN